MVLFLAFVVFKESRMSQPTLPLANDGAEKKLVKAMLNSASRAPRVQPDMSALSPLLGVHLE